MSHPIKVTLVLEIKGHTVELTPAEIKQLRDELDRLIPVDAAPYIPYVPYSPPIDYTKWPQFTFTGTGDPIPPFEGTTC